MAGQHGGARPGSGRKPAPQKHAGPVAAAEQRISDRLPELVEQLLKLATGGDRQALTYLLDRVMGKLTARQELTGEDGGPIQIMYVNDWREMGTQPEDCGKDGRDVPIPGDLVASMGPQSPGCSEIVCD